MKTLSDRYSDKFGENLGNLVATIPQYDTITVDGFCNRIHDFIEDYIMLRNPTYDFESLAPYQKTFVEDAEVYQAFYVVHGVDFTQASGYDSNSGALMDKATIRERQICDNARNRLLRARVLHREPRDMGARYDG